MLTVLSQTTWSSYICALFSTISPAKKHCSSAPAALHGILQDDLELQGGAPERRLHDRYGDRFLEDALFEDQLTWRWRDGYHTEILPNTKQYHTYSMLMATNLIAS